MRALISGASIAGPVLADWLTRSECDVTVVERAPALRKTGGHAIDLFRPGMEISERMGVLPLIESRATGTTMMTVRRPGSSRVARIDYAKLIAVTSDRHVEIMRDDLSEIYYDAASDDVEYIFGDQIVALSDDGDVTFEHGRPRQFDVIIGADGLHSGVRRVVFGPDTPERFLGGYLAVLSVPKSLAREGEMNGYYDANRLAMIYTADHLTDARAVFLFRPAAPVAYDHRDTPLQRQLLRDAFGGADAQVDSWLAEMGDASAHTRAFYFDAITQLEMTSWSRGRVTLVGDAGYCPGPAVGGSTSLAVYGAYVLAAELARANGNHVDAFAAYERTMRAPVVGSRAFARQTAKTLVPGSQLGVTALIGLGRLISILPMGVTSRIARLNTKGVRLYESMPVPDFPAGAVLAG